jgi:hypothetical protein
MGIRLIFLIAMFGPVLALAAVENLIAIIRKWWAKVN